MSAEMMATIYTQYPSFSIVEKDIANYIISNGPKVIYMPITELATHCKVGETSIMRFCRRIGQPGYHAFRLALATALAEESRFIKQQAPESMDGMERLLDDIEHKYALAINVTRHMLNGNMMRNIANQLIHAREVFYFGLDQSMSTALCAGQYISAVIQKGVFYYSAEKQLAMTNEVVHDDAALFFSHCGSNKNLLEMAEKVRTTGAYCIGVTCCGKSPLNAFCQSSIYCGCNADPKKPTEIDKTTGKAASAYVIECIAAACQEWIKHPFE
ncbi:MAG: MurR/RpiR family transcriptional regulator [Eubacteriales bacterium]|nr:MurR/RpiR family transcriptional regulator [Eubacteriales bacterium]